MSKTLTIKEAANRVEQFQHIAELKFGFQEKGQPILSVDVKKKEFIEQFYRDGKSYCKAAVKVYDYDFSSLVEVV